MSPKIKSGVFGAGLLFLLLFACCRQGSMPESLPSGSRDCDSVHSVFALSRPGYIILRQGRGMVSGFIARHYSGGHRVSHSGIIADTGGKQMVVHAISSVLHSPGGVVCEPLEVFVREADRGRIVLLRPAGSDSLLLLKTAREALAMYRRGVPFDSRFDASDTTAVFCNELVSLVLKRVYGKGLPDGGEAHQFGYFFNHLIFNAVLDTACDSRNNW